MIAVMSTGETTWGIKTNHKPFIKELCNSKTYTEHLLCTRPCPEVAKGPLSDTDMGIDVGYRQSFCYSRKKPLLLN